MREATSSQTYLVLLLVFFDIRTGIYMHMLGPLGLNHTNVGHESRKHITSVISSTRHATKEIQSTRVVKE
jgi:hypothetical protein